MDLDLVEVTLDLAGGVFTTPFGVDCVFFADGMVFPFASPPPLPTLLTDLEVTGIVTSMMTEAGGDPAREAALETGFEVGPSDLPRLRPRLRSRGAPTLDLDFDFDFNRVDGSLVLDRPRDRLGVAIGVAGPVAAVEMELRRFRGVDDMPVSGTGVPARDRDRDLGLLLILAPMLSPSGASSSSKSGCRTSLIPSALTEPELSGSTGTASSMSSRPISTSTST